MKNQANFSPTPALPSGLWELSQQEREERLMEEEMGQPENWGLGDAAGDGAAL